MDADMAWTADVDVKTAKGKDNWSVEARLPLAQFGVVANRVVSGASTSGASNPAKASSDWQPISYDRTALVSCRSVGTAWQAKQGRESAPEAFGLVPCLRMHVQHDSGQRVLDDVVNPKGEQRCQASCRRRDARNPALLMATSTGSIPAATLSARRDDPQNAGQESD